jgi:hypothetical protein
MSLDAPASLAAVAEVAVPLPVPDGVAAVVEPSLIVPAAGVASALPTLVGELVVGVVRWLVVSPDIVALLSVEVDACGAVVPVEVEVVGCAVCAKALVPAISTAAARVRLRMWLSFTDVSAS